jgi:hypothetical protein
MSLPQKLLVEAPMEELLSKDSQMVQEIRVRLIDIDILLMWTEVTQ